MGQRIPVGILGATGTVGQRFIQLLEHHPWFEVAWLAASDRSTGKTYAEACKWKLDTPMPPAAGKMQVSLADPATAPRLIFASVDASIALELEPKFAAAGKTVITNSSAFRMHENVPLIIPEVNADHLPMIEKQEWRNSGGCIVANGNCTAIGLILPIAPLHRAFGLDKVFVVSMQAVSGAGYPGVPSLDILGNVVPYIAKEEEKLEEEAHKMLGAFHDGKIISADFAISASCNRVPVIDGHTESVSVKLKKKASATEIIAAITDFRGQITDLNLPSAPKQIVYYESAPDRPQPRLDVNRGNGMTATVGRLRPCNILDWKFTVLSHNVIRGAAGAALLNAELMKAKGYLD